MTYRITIPEPLEQKLRERAAAAGTDAATFIVETLAEKLESPKSFHEIFAPLHHAFAESPIPEEELALLVDQARDDHYRAMQSRKSGIS